MVLNRAPRFEVDEPGNGNPKTGKKKKEKKEKKEKKDKVVTL